MSYLLPHLRTGWAVDQAIINEEERVVCLRFGHDHDVTCMQMDEVLAGIAEDVKNFCAIYVVDVSEVKTLQLLLFVVLVASTNYEVRNSRQHQALVLRLSADSAQHS